eukprot:355924-Chlamydomonas_euryale.AAC.8
MDHHASIQSAPAIARPRHVCSWEGIAGEYLNAQKKVLEAGDAPGSAFMGRQCRPALAAYMGCAGQPFILFQVQQGISVPCSGCATVTMQCEERRHQQRPCTHQVHAVSRLCLGHGIGGASAVGG